MSWKQEVNRRVAAHKGSKTPATNGPAANGLDAQNEGRPSPTARAAQVAARVAARYANAPSFNEALADDARAAVRAAEAASRAAQEAHAAAQSILAGLEAADPAWESQSAPDCLPERQAAPAMTPAPQDQPETLPANEGPLFASRKEPGAPTRKSEPVPARANRRQHRPTIIEARTDDWDEPASTVAVDPGANDLHGGETAQPIYANLIQFPREMVATRKVRPRRAEGPLASASSASQLSIFEVDPETISTQPAAAAVDEPATPAWMRAEWSGIELEAQPQEELLEAPASQALPPALELAPLSRRLLAIVVDAALIAVAFLAAAVLAASKLKQLPGPHAVELAAALAVLAIGAAYQTLFFTLAKATPGMRYAGIELRTFEGHNPTRAQRYGRLVALLLSALPLALGLVWALFDDGHLTWHDRLSRTYLRKF